MRTSIVTRFGRAASCARSCCCRKSSSNAIARVLLGLAQRGEIDHADAALLDRHAFDDSRMRVVAFRREEPLDGRVALAARDDRPAALLSELRARLGAQTLEDGRDAGVASVYRLAVGGQRRMATAMHNTPLR